MVPRATKRRVSFPAVDAAKRCLGHGGQQKFRDLDELLPV